jgi:uncharacterized membrane protein
VGADWSDAVEDWRNAVKLVRGLLVAIVACVVVFVIGFDLLNALIGSATAAFVVAALVSAGIGGLIVVDAAGESRQDWRLAKIGKEHKRETSRIKWPQLRREPLKWLLTLPLRIVFGLAKTALQTTGSIVAFVAICWVTLSAFIAAWLIADNEIFGMHHPWLHPFGTTGVLGSQLVVLAVWIGALIALPFVVINVIKGLTVDQTSRIMWDRQYRDFQEGRSNVDPGPPPPVEF